MPPIRLLIVDNHELFRQGLRLACEAHGDCEVVGEAGNGAEAVDMATRLRPDVILMDIEMPVMDGVQATRLITAELPTTQVVVLTAYQTDGYAFEAIKAGASGYVLKDTSPRSLMEAIRAVHRGDVLIDAHVAGRVLEEFRRLNAPVAPASLPSPTSSRTEEPAAVDTDVDHLTDGEMAVLRLVAQGYDNQRIAGELNIAVKTITTRLSVIYEKLRVNNRTQAALYALRRGWAPLAGEDRSA